MKPPGPRRAPDLRFKRTFLRKRKTPGDFTYNDTIDALMNSAGMEQPRAERLLDALVDRHTGAAGGSTEPSLPEATLYRNVHTVLSALRDKHLGPIAIRFVIEYGPALFLDPPQLLDTLEYLQSMQLRQSALHRSAMKCPQLLHCKLADLKAVTSHLKHSGVPGPKLFRLLKREPQIFTLNAEKQLKPAIRRLRAAAVTADALPRAIQQCPRCLLYTDEMIRGTLDFLKSRGCSEADIRRFVSRNPAAFQYSAAAMDLKWTFFTQVMGLSTATITGAHSRLLFSASLVDKVGPRHAIVRDGHLHALKWQQYLKASDAAFCKMARISVPQYRGLVKAWACDHGDKWSTGYLSNAEMQRRRRKVSSMRSKARQADPAQAAGQ